MQWYFLFDFHEPLLFFFVANVFLPLSGVASCCSFFLNFLDFGVLLEDMAFPGCVSGYLHGGRAFPMRAEGGVC